MNEEQLAFILRYSSPVEILIINRSNRLEVLKCPFGVVPLENLGSLTTGKIYYVELVLVDKNITTVYKINGLHYYYYHFKILEFN